jgi:hypothetical protein
MTWRMKDSWTVEANGKYETEVRDTLFPGGKGGERASYFREFPGNVRCFLWREQGTTEGDKVKSSKRLR